MWPLKGDHLYINVIIFQLISSDKQPHLWKVDHSDRYQRFNQPVD